MVAEVFVVLTSGYISAQVGYHKKKKKKCRSLQLVLMKRIQISGAVPRCSPCVFIAPPVLPNGEVVQSGCLLRVTELLRVSELLW